MLTFFLGRFFGYGTEIQFWFPGNLNPFCPKIMEYVYLLRVFAGAKDNIFKYGRTARHFPERFKEYSKVNPIIVMVLACQQSNLLEKRTLKQIRERFVQRPDLGREYFEGPIDDIKNIVLNEYDGHNEDWPIGQGSTKTEIPVSSLDPEDFSWYIRDNLGDKKKLRESFKERSELADGLPEVLVTCPTENDRMFLSIHLKEKNNIKGQSIIRQALRDPLICRRISDESLVDYLRELVIRFDYMGYRESIKLYEDLGLSVKPIDFLESVSTEYDLCPKDIELFLGPSE